MTDAANLTPIVRLAPAKLNLTLAVVGRRDDGFHDLHSVFVPLGLHDVLTLAPSGGTGADTLHVAGLDAGSTEANLVLRAIAAARETVGVGPGRPATPPLAARLEKRIPVAAGLGGGSSDAAAAFDAALEAWGARDLVDADRWRSAAASIGSDVPFFLTASPALVEGRGERVTPLKGVHGHPGILLVTPRVTVRTPDVFAVFDGARRGAAGDGAVRMTSAHLAQELGNGLSATDLVARAGVLAAANDLLPAAAMVAPGLIDVRGHRCRMMDLLELGQIDAVDGEIEAHAALAAELDQLDLGPGWSDQRQRETAQLEWRDLWVDLCVGSRAEVEALGVQVGDRVVWNTTLQRRGDYIYGKALDNRVALALMDALLERVRPDELAYELYLGSSVQEEIGLIGAHSINREVGASYAIALDIALRGDVPGVDQADVSARLGGGPVLVHKDLYAYHAPLTYAIADVAADVLALMDALALERASLVGVSMGGFVALELALPGTPFHRVSVAFAVGATIAGLLLMRTVWKERA